MNLRDATTPRPVSPTTFELEIEDGWQQGRGAFGGLALAAMVRALSSALDEGERTLRVLTAELFGPVQPGKIDIEVSRLRVGSGVSTVVASLSQAGAPMAHAVGVFGRARVLGVPLAASASSRALSPPPLSTKPWRDVTRAPIQAPVAPVFAQHFEYRVTGQVPFMGAREPITEGWVRAVDPGPARDAAYVVAHADAWWPSSLVCESMPRPMVTVAFTLELVTDLDGLDPEAPLYHRGSCVAGRDGFLVDFRELWGEDGRLVALNQQTIVVVK